MFYSRGVRSRPQQNRKRNSENPEIFCPRVKRRGKVSNFRKDSLLLPSLSQAFEQQSTLVQLVKRMFVKSVSCVQQLWEDSDQFATKIDQARGSGVYSGDKITKAFLKTYLCRLIITATLIIKGRRMDTNVYSRVQSQRITSLMFTECEWGKTEPARV